MNTPNYSILELLKKTSPDLSENEISEYTVGIAVREVANNVLLTLIETSLNKVNQKNTLNEVNQEEDILQRFGKQLGNIDSLFGLNNYNICIKYNPNNTVEDKSNIIGDYLIHLLKDSLPLDKITTYKQENKSALMDIKIGNYTLYFYGDFYGENKKEIQLKQQSFKKQIAPAILKILTSIHLTLDFLYKVNYDDLTKLKNNKLIIDRSTLLLNKAIEKKSTIAFLYIDLDNFKRINDTYGHESGDLVLIEVAKVLLKLEKKYGGFTGRKGGEELCYVIEGKTIDEVKKIGLEVQDKIKSISFFISDKIIKQTASIGIGFSDFSRCDKLRTIDDLISFSDDLMYIAKSTGRNKIIFNTFCSTESSKINGKIISTNKDNLNKTKYLEYLKIRKKEIKKIIQDNIDSIESGTFLSSLGIYFEDKELVEDILTELLNSKNKKNYTTIINAISIFLNIVESSDLVDLNE